MKEFSQPSCLGLADGPYTESLISVVVLIAVGVREITLDLN
jgi:hypothetical protein